MRVAIVVFAYYSRDSRVRRYAEALASQGYLVDCLCFLENYTPRERNISLIGFPMQRRRLGRVWYLLEYLLFFLFTGLVLFFRNIKGKYALVYINNMPEVLVFAAFAPKISGAKLFLDIHDPTPELYMSKYHRKKESLSVKFLKILERASLQFADKVVTANEMFKKTLLKRNPGIPANKIDVILNCPDPRLFDPKGRMSPGKNRFNIYYMGTVEERLAIDVIIASLPVLIKIIPFLKFILIPKLASEGSYYMRLRRQIHSLRLSKHVSILPPLPLEKIAESLKRADVGVVLAKKDDYTNIIFPLKLLEFIQMKIPVVAVRTKLLGRCFTDSQIMFLESPTEGEFTQKILEFFKDPRLRYKYAVRATEYLKEHNWMKEKKKFLSVINTHIKK